LEELRKLVADASSQSFPKSQLLETAQTVLTEADKVVRVAKTLVGTPVRTR